MNKTFFAAVVAVPVLMLAMSLPGLADSTAAAPTKTCTDGTTSTATGKGACSGHGGVQKASPGTTGAMAKPAADAAAAPPAAAKLTPAPATSAAPPDGATAKCKDGTFSKSKSHSGACSKHGGVSDWLTAAK